MPKSKSPYLVLGIARNADTSEVKRAYRKLVLELHPDRNEGRESQRLHEVQSAYDALCDARGGGQAEHADSLLKQEVERDSIVRPEPEPMTYSVWRHAIRFNPEPYASSGAEDLARRTRVLFASIDEMLGGVVPEVFSDRPASVPKDLFVEVALTRDEARLGGTFPLTIPVQRQCPACLGSGLGGLTEHCTRCKGRGCDMTSKEMDLVVPRDVVDGQETEIELATEGPSTRLRVVVRVV